MKKLLPIGLALASLSAAPVFAAAGDDGIHFGLKTGAMDVDFSGVDIDMPIGLVLGFEKGVYGAEVEYTFADMEFDVFGSTETLDFDTLAVYGVFRSQGEVYFKLKAGFLREDVGGVDDTGASLGLGGGVRVENLSIEAEYTIIEEDVNFLSIGANVHF